MRELYRICFWKCAPAAPRPPQVTWFAGLFYIVRLFIYQTEAEQKPEPAKEILQTQYKLMSKRLWYIITWPSAILASVFAFWMLYTNPYYLEEPWMLIKLSFVFALYFYHGYCHKIFIKLQHNVVKYTALKDKQRDNR